MRLNSHQTTVLLCAATLLGCAKPPNDDSAAAHNRERHTDQQIVLPADSPKRALIQTGLAEDRSVTLAAFSAPARIILDPDRSTRIRAPLPGRVQQVHVRQGSAVSIGQPLLALDSPEAEAARARHRQAVAARELAYQDAERARELHALDALATRERLAIENELEQAEAELAEARYALEALQLSATASGTPLTIRAPMAGRVLELDVRRGEFIHDIDEPLLTIADLSQVWAVVAVPEHRVRLLRPDGSVELSLSAFPGASFEGTILHISDTLDPETRTLPVFVELANPDGRVRPEMFGTARFVEPPQTLPAVPIGSVLHRSKTPIVIVEREPGRYEVRAVELTRPEGEWQPVRSGIATGERIVIDSALLLLAEGGHR